MKTQKNSTDKIVRIMVKKTMEIMVFHTHGITKRQSVQYGVFDEKALSEGEKDKVYEDFVYDTFTKPVIREA